MFLKINASTKGKDYQMANPYPMNLRRSDNSEKRPHKPYCLVINLLERKFTYLCAKVLSNNIYLESFIKLMCSATIYVNRHCPITEHYTNSV